MSTVIFDQDLETFWVKSRSKENEWYECFDSRLQKRWVCNCPGYSLHHKYKGNCRHIQITLYYITTEPEQISFLIKKIIWRQKDKIKYIWTY